MHRPTRKHAHLQLKLDKKAARSRRIGKKARRWASWSELYKALNKA